MHAFSPVFFMENMLFVHYARFLCCYGFCSGRKKEGRKMHPFLENCGIY
ncbi:hypothetical protein SB48_HM08orf03444 [Heyndrickxia coagulans]|uniref:Uncharacterized protein n=1 Tax=Heyndrickxia coagulans TaxID=1398 RepID=A0AAN0T6K4_HEYCO|nr:hypothetical protein SB48_HM08orf03444 [Heyndrickxia coagulans]